MHFAKCKKPDVLNGCPQRPHGHLWADDEEIHRIVNVPALTNKADAKDIVSELLFLGSEPARANLVAKFKADIQASDLPENSMMEGVPTKKGSHLRLVK